jgi:hypothetical protein
LFDRTQFRMRIGIVLALATACAWLPVARDNRVWLAGFLLLARPQRRPALVAGQAPVEAR